MHCSLAVAVWAFLGGCVAAMPVSYPQDIARHFNVPRTDVGSGGPDINANHITGCSSDLLSRAFRGALYHDFVKQVLEAENVDCCTQHAACYEAGKRKPDCDNEMRTCFTEACVRRRDDQDSGSTECHAWDEVSWMIT